MHQLQYCFRYDAHHGYVRYVLLVGSKSEDAWHTPSWLMRLKANGMS